jgi:hypothetical protein
MLNKKFLGRQIKATKKLVLGSPQTNYQKTQVSIDILQLEVNDLSAQVKCLISSIGIFTTKKV